MYLDVAIGLLIGLLVAVFSGEYSPWLPVFGVVAALAPDLDFIVYLVRNKGRVDQYAHEHRDLLHKPLLFSVGGASVVMAIDPVYAIIWLLGTLWHFVHDTFDGGWGIRWAHPFSGGYFTRAKYSPKKYFKDKADQHATAATHGNPDWLAEDYLRLSRRIIRQIVFLGVVLAGVCLWLWYGT